MAVSQTNDFNLQPEANHAIGYTAAFINVHFITFSPGVKWNIPGGPVFSI